MDKFEPIPGLEPSTADALVELERLDAAVVSRELSQDMADHLKSSMLEDPARYFEILLEYRALAEHIRPVITKILKTEGDEP